MGMVKQWKSFPREAEESPCVEILRIQLGKALGSLF